MEDPGGRWGGGLVGALAVGLEEGAAHHVMLQQARAALGPGARADGEALAGGAAALRALAESPLGGPMRRREVQLTALILGALEAETGRVPGRERLEEGVFRAARAPPQLPGLEDPGGTSARAAAADLVDACLACLQEGEAGGAGLAAPQCRLSTRSLLKVSQAFCLGREDLSPAGLRGLSFRAQALLAEGPASLVGGLVVQFRMGELVESGRLLEFLAEEGRDEQSAGALASFLVESVQVRYIERLLERGRYKAAHKCTQELGLEVRFPLVERQYWDSTLRKLARKGQWDVAGSFIERKDQNALAPYLLDLALQDGNMTAALKLKDRFPELLGEADFSERMEELGVDEVSIRSRYLSLPSAVAVEIVDSLATLEAAAAALAGAEVIGIDCEWKPKFNKGEPASEVALCQLATADRVFLLDMLALSGCGDGRGGSALNEALAVFISRGPALKIGYSVHEDLRRMARICPCFRCVPNVVDLAQMRDFYARGRRPPPRGGLAGLAEECLGQPLNKAMQMSNWEERPLSLEQCQYAALDAFCLLPLREALLKKEAQEEEPRDLDTLCAYTYSTGEKRGRHGSLDTSGASRQKVPPPRPDVPPLSHRDVQKFVATHGMDALPQPVRVFRTPAETASTSEAAAALSLDPSCILKSLCVVESSSGREDGLAVVLVLQGDKTASLRRVEVHLGLPPGSIRMASPSECLFRFGYAPGTVPPFGHRDGVTVLVDSLVVESAEDFYAGGGSLDHSVGPLKGAVLRDSGSSVAKISTNGPPVRSERLSGLNQDQAGANGPLVVADAGRWRRIQNWLLALARPVKGVILGARDGRRPPRQASPPRGVPRGHRPGGPPRRRGP